MQNIENKIQDIALLFKIYENIVCLNDVTKNSLTTLRK